MNQFLLHQVQGCAVLSAIVSSPDVYGGRCKKMDATTSNVRRCGTQEPVGEDTAGVGSGQLHVTRFIIPDGGQIRYVFTLLAWNRPNLGLSSPPLTY